MAIPIQAILGAAQLGQGLYGAGQQMASAQGPINAKQAMGLQYMRNMQGLINNGQATGQQRPVFPNMLQPYSFTGPTINPGAIPNNESGRRASIINELAMARQALDIATMKHKGMPRPELVKGNPVKEARDRIKFLEGELEDLDKGPSKPRPGRSTSLSIDTTPNVTGDTAIARRQQAASGGGVQYPGLGQEQLNETPQWLKGFLAEANQEQNQAKAANESRYQEILQGYKNRTAKADAQLNQLGATETRNIGDRYQTGRASAEQDLIDRGLGNTTIRSSVMAGLGERKSRELTDLAENQARMRLEYMPTLTGEQLSFMERRNDVGPNLGNITQLAAGLGRSGFGLPGNVTGPNNNSKPSGPVYQSGQFPGLKLSGDAATQEKQFLKYANTQRARRRKPARSRVA